MSFLRLVRFLQGNIKFQVSGGFVERFINLCALRNLQLWEIEYKDSAIVAYIKMRDYKKLQDVCEKSGMKRLKLEENGLPFVIKRNSNRVGLVVGAVFFICFMGVSSLFIWSVEVSESSNVNDEILIETLDEIGLKVGTLKSKIETKDITKTALMNFQGKLTWMAINIRGCKAFVETRDYHEVKIKEPFSSPSNLVANFDAVILSIEVESGVKSISEGSAVKKGDILITGAVQNLYQQFHYIESRGEVTAYHETEIEMSYGTSLNSKKVVDEKQVYTLNFFGIKIPLGFSCDESEWEAFSQTKTLAFDNFKLPFALTKTTYIKYENAKIEAEKAQMIAVDEFTKTCLIEHENTNVLTQKFNIDTDKSKLKIAGNFECIDFIGVQEDLSVF